MISSPLRAGALAAAAIGLASALAACASTSGTVSAGAGSTASPGATATAPAASAPATPGPSASQTASTGSSGEPNPGGPIKTPSPTGTPVVQVTKPPTKAIYVPIDKESASGDGRTLYLEIEARGGACGQYTVVVQESSTEVRVGLAQLPVKPGIMCPMYIGPRVFDAKLMNPIGSRPVFDLAHGTRL
ncbi:MAG: hypothetical protein ACRDSS_08515 [Actinocrinis sp.]